MGRFPPFLLAIDAKDFLGKAWVAGLLLLLLLILGEGIIRDFSGAPVFASS